MSSSVDRGRLPSARRTVEKVIRLAQRATRASIDIGVGRSYTEVVIDAVRVCLSGPQEIGRRDAGDENDVFELEIGGLVRPGENAIVCSHHALAPAAVADPGDAVRVDMAVHHAISDR